MWWLFFQYTTSLGNLRKVWDEGSRGPRDGLLGVRGLLGESLTLWTYKQITAVWRCRREEIWAHMTEVGSLIVF